jgi:hypothetical protein
MHVETADRRRTRKRDQLQESLRVYSRDIVWRPKKVILFKSIFKLINFYIDCVEWKQMNGNI